MSNKLDAGYDIEIMQRVNNVSTPVYPITKTSNVKDAETGETLKSLLEGKAPTVHGNHVPSTNEDLNDGVHFLSTDNTWKSIREASTTDAGIVQLSNATNLEDETVAATAKAIKAVADKIDTVSTNLNENYVENSKVGVANGIATLDNTGHVPAAQLPSFVDDVVEGYLNDDGSFYKEETFETAVTPESGKIYTNLTDNKTYRWSGTKYTVISDTIALGETESTAFRGDLGKVAYDHANEEHAMVDATKVEASEKNGYVKVTTKDSEESADVLVYTHPGSGTNPHGTTAEDIGLGNVENLTSAEILNKLSTALIIEKLGYTPQDASVIATKTQSGIMTAAQASKLANCMQMEVVNVGEEPTITDGIIFQIL